MMTTTCALLLAALCASHPQAALPQRALAAADTLGKRPASRAAAPGAPAAVRAVRVAQPIRVDGVLDDAAWQTAQPISDFHQRDPNEGAAPTQRTVVRIVYDEDALYVGAELFDTAPDSIRTLLARRDRDANADRFVVFLDPYNDKRTGFYFGVNAAGTLYDGTLYNDDWDSDTWDGVWEGKAQRTAQGWTVEMRIPYSQLRFQKRETYTWGVNFRRDIARNNEVDYLVYTPKDGSGFVSRFRELGGLSGITPPRRLEVLPYVTSKAEFLDHAAGDPFNDGSRMSPGAGADVKFGLGGNLTLDATVNPDFGQVEVDPAVVNLSDAETFFEEKRPFFIEGANILTQFGSGGANNFWGFNNPTPDFFYSRRIGRSPQLSPSEDGAAFVDRPTGTHILGAAKLTGKIGDWSIGTLSAFTQREQATYGLAGRRWQDEVEPFTYYGAARALKEFGQGRQGLGFIATSVLRDPASELARTTLDRSALTFGVDGWTFLDKDRTWALTGWVGGSRVAGTADAIAGIQQNPIHYFQRPDASEVSFDPARTSLAGAAGRFTLNKQKGNWYSNSAIAFVSPGFESNDLGFQWTSNVVNAHQVIGYRWRTPTSWYRRINVNTAYARSIDFAGNTTHSMVWGNSSIQLRNFWSLYGGANWLPDRISNRMTRGGPRTIQPGGFGINGGFDSDDRKAITFGMSGYADRFKLGSDENWGVSGYAEWKPIDRLTVRVSPALDKTINAAQYVGVLDDARYAATFGRQYVFAGLHQTTLSSELRVNWIFNPRLSLEMYAQPFVSTVDYADLKALARPRSYDFTPTDGTAGGSAVTANDYTFASLRGNAVLRWEYLPGSTLFLVWTQDRSDTESIGDFRPGHSFDRIFSGRANNIFAVKVSYWWNP